MRDQDSLISDFRTLAWPLYAVAGLMIVLPLGDLLASVWPPNPAQLQWRFGTLGLISGFLLTPLFGIVILVLCAAILEHRTFQRIVAVANILAAVCLAAVVVIFALDWLQFRASAPPEAKASMDLGSVKALVKDVLVAGGFAWLGIAGWRAGRREHRARHAQPPLMREPDQPAS